MYKYILCLSLLASLSSISQAQSNPVFGYDAYPKQTQALLIDEKQFGTITRQQLQLTAPFSEAIPFYLAYPKQQKINQVVFLLHGITSSKDIWWQGSGPYSLVREYREQLLEQGYAVVAVDARFHGQRAHQGAYRSAKLLAVEQKPHGLRDLVVNSVIDLRRVIDYLQSRPEFAQARFGSLGISLGGIHSMAFAAADSRIEFTVPIFPPPMAPAPAWPVFPMGIAQQLNTSTLLLLADKDEWYSLDQGKALFDKIASDDKTLMILASQHDPEVTQAKKVMQWIKQH